ncbi:EAL domain-containing protein [Paracoccus aurantiacus]|uniref:EAL domain-containing protein n=1 Tax=Paracoccus aurantiacus TaxID=2599412 RepID=UPI00164AF3D4
MATAESRPKTRPLPGPRFRVQLCCHTGAAVSVQAFAPGYLVNDTDGLLRLGLQQLKAWDAAGLHVPQLAIELPTTISRHKIMADPLIWEIDRQSVATNRLIFCAGSDAGRMDEQAGLALLAQHGCSLEISSTDPADLRALRDMRIVGARLRIAEAELRNCDRDANSSARAQSLLMLADRYGLASLADGVSTPRQHGLLAQLGCSVVQGDAIAPLLDADATTYYLRNLTAIDMHPVAVPRSAA